jgi:hypothetical protein
MLMVISYNLTAAAFLASWAEGVTFPAPLVRSINYSVTTSPLQRVLFDSSRA